MTQIHYYMTLGTIKKPSLHLIFFLKKPIELSQTLIATNFSELLSKKEVYH